MEKGKEVEDEDSGKDGRKEDTMKGNEEGDEEGGCDRCNSISKMNEETNKIHAEGTCSCPGNTLRK